MTPLRGASTTAVLVTLFAGVAAVPVRAQAGAAPVQATAAASAETLFSNASAEEAAVRKVLAQASPAATVLKAVRTVVADYEQVVRHYPASSVSDDALWRAARLSRDAFDRFHETPERAAAVRLFNLLASKYPDSTQAREVPAELAALNTRRRAVVPAAIPAAASAPEPEPARAAVVSPATAAPVQSPAFDTAAAPAALPSNAPTGAAAPAPRLANIKGIRRAVLQDVVRVVIELDMEVPFHDERLDGPPRVFVDLPSTRANMALIDQTLRFDDDADLVRQIRIGRHPNSTTRVVLDAAGVSSYSVYPLYSPYRLVIDCLRERPRLTRVEPTPLVPIASAVIPPPAHVPARSAAPESAALPAVAPPLGAPPLLAARSLAWAVQLPAGMAPGLGKELEEARELPQWVTTLAARPANPLPATPTVPPRSTPLPSVEASQNLAGGLSIARQLGLGVSRIVIDPGHGGHDPGAKGRGVTEAELVLDIALRLEKLLAKLPGIEVVLTRREDQFVSLQERTAIANREGADLFLSIHANASGVASARGVETYFLDFASNQGAAAVAARENATSEQTMGALQDVVKAIALNNKLDESRDFATYVQREMMSTLRASNKTLKDLGVKKAPFVVLIGAAMPSVLAEVSFVTNPQEAKLLKGAAYRQRIAQALFEGVKKYQASLKRMPAVAQQQQ
jgi:N-acetylmuramoyl-L-alanine amidase